MVRLAPVKGIAHQLEMAMKRMRFHISGLLISFGLLVGSSPNYALGQAELQLVAENLVSPIDLATLPDDSSRRLILDQSGVIHLLLSDNSIASKPFLDIKSRMLPLREDFEERGLLGMAIHPEFKTNGRVYVTYTAPLGNDAPGTWSHTRIVSEFSIDPQLNDQLDPKSERVLIRQHWPSRKHNGGALGFGPDGYLYIGFGDGGGIHGVGPETLNDAYSVPINRLHWDSTAQDMQSLYGKLLRIDVDNGLPGYAIPSDNPMIGKLGLSEIYAWGFRNPYRISFDPNGSGDLYITAVAETLWEAVYRVDGPGNYGWPLKESTHCFERTTPLMPPAECALPGSVTTINGTIEDPVVEYPNMSVHREGSNVDVVGVGTAVVGAVMHRNGEPTQLQNQLLFADWSLDFQTPSGQLFAASESSDPLWSYEKLATLETRIIALVQDTDDRKYIMTNQNFGPYGNTGKVFQLKFAHE